MIKVLRNASIFLFLALFGSIFFTTNNPENKKLVEIQNDKPSQSIEQETQENSIAKIEFGWNKIDFKEITHYEVVYGNKGEFKNSKIVLNRPSNEKRVKSGKLEYPKNEVIVAGVRACTAKKCSDINGFLVEGLRQYNSKHKIIESDNKLYGCEIASKDNHGYIMIYWGKSDSSLWDRVIYFEKKSDGELEFKEFDMDSEDGHKVSI